MMTRKHFEAVAAAMHDARVGLDEFGATFPVSGEEMHAEIIGRLAAVFAADNPNFSRARFIVACK